jgi:hypothetical protein
MLISATPQIPNPPKGGRDVATIGKTVASKRIGNYPSRKTAAAAE